MKALKNKERRAKQTILHTSGSKSFARLHFEEESRSGKGPNRSSLFVMTHSHKDGTPVSTKAVEKIAIIKDLMSQSPPLTQRYKQGCISWDPNDPYGQAFGKERPGHVRGVGVGCRSGSVASLSSSYLPQVCCNDLEHAGVSNFMKEFQMFKTLFANSHISQMRNVPNFNNDYTPVLLDCVTNAYRENNEDHCEEEANA